MSHDQKPGKVRVVANAASAAGRRRDDGHSEGYGPSSMPADADAAGEIADPSVAKRPAFLLPLLFVAGCAIGGAALPLLEVM